MHNISVTYVSCPVGIFGTAVCRLHISAGFTQLSISTLLSASMAATLPPGAYVIRNRQTWTIIHAKDGVKVITSSRDEERHRERQN
jgi:hypothetical protein